MDNPYALTHKTPTQKDFLDTTNLDQAEFLDIVKTSVAVRDFLRTGKTLDSLHHKTLAMIFEQKSTRTRVACEVSMEQLGGHALDLAPGATHLGVHENITDTARALSRMVDYIIARVAHHETLLALALNSPVPVLNAMSNYNHPIQEIADIITILDHLPAGKSWSELKIVFVGNCTPTCVSLMMATTKLGMNFVQYSPPSKWLSDDLLKIGRANTQTYGGSVHVTDNPAYIAGADFIYTDVWFGSYDQETPKDLYLREFYPKYQVNQDLLALVGNPEAKFMHRLPALRGEEVTDDVLDGPNSLVWDAAENILTAQRGILLYFSGQAQATLDKIKDQSPKDNAS